MANMAPRLISPDWRPSDYTMDWCAKRGISKRVIEEQLLDFHINYLTKKRRRKDFELCFQNWIKNYIKYKKRDNANNKSKEEKASQSYGTYIPAEKVVKNKEAGREAIRKMKGKI